MHSILNHYQIILESIEEGVFTVTPELKIMSFNRAAEKITGFNRKDVIGRSCREIFQTDICSENCRLRQSIETGESFSNYPLYITRADEKRIPISLNTAVLKAGNGNIIGGVEIFRDLTPILELRKAFLKEHSFEDIVSKNPKMQRYFSILPQIAESQSTVLIEGPTGTGKELIARAIHSNSPQKNGPFIAVNCGALPDTLLESELFGYKKGAFTDAKQDKPGRFALAQNGTIFLDEIGDISQAAQVRLLRVLQDKTYEPLGGRKSVETNARVITATHRNLEEQVGKNLFREDLFYRINVIKLSLPPLSERKEDIPLLIDHFIKHQNYAANRKILGLTQEAMAACMLYDWPGNVRELENSIEHAFVLCRDSLLGLHHLPERIAPGIEPFHAPKGLTLKEIERTTIQQALEQNHWKKVITARKLGIDKNTLRRKIKRLSIIEPAET
ncbi:MAG: PAS domain-containing protein [Desulfobacteraceae bacterium]|nr:MAG: PAS domain-containing protein [Desulfobacteraceae bacterium]